MFSLESFRWCEVLRGAPRWRHEAPCGGDALRALIAAPCSDMVTFAWPPPHATKLLIDDEYV